MQNGHAVAMPVGVLHDDGIALRARRTRRPAQAGKAVAAILGVLERDVAAIGKGRRGDGKMRAFLGREFGQGVGAVGHGRRRGLGGRGGGERGKEQGRQSGFHGVSPDIFHHCNRKSLARLGSGLSAPGLSLSSPLGEAHDGGRCLARACLRKTDGGY
jgi:hypothetical protein